MAMSILKGGVICTPGRAFGEQGERHIRFSYANSQDNIKKAMERIRQHLEKEFGGKVK
jgi:aspartate aminotransferase